MNQTEQFQLDNHHHINAGSGGGRSTQAPAFRPRRLRSKACSVPLADPGAVIGFETRRSA